MSRVINGEGPMPCSVLLVGQRPGAEEIRRGRPFCGPSGQELDRFLAVNAGLDRSRVFVTNLVRTYEGEDEITPEEIARDWPALMEEIEAVQPDYIGLVGLYAARAFLGPDIEMEVFHGLCFRISVCTRCGQVSREGSRPDRNRAQRLLAMEGEIDTGHSEQGSEALHVHRKDSNRSVSIPLLGTEEAYPDGLGATSQVPEYHVCQSRLSGIADKEAAYEKAPSKGMPQWSSYDRAQRDALRGIQWPRVSHLPKCPKKEALPTTAICLYHPASSLHQATIAPRVAWDFTELGRLISGEEMPTGHLADEWPEPKYREGDTEGIRTDTIAMDTEGTVESPWCMSYSTVPGTGVVCRRPQYTLGDALVVGHNLLHDIPVLAAMGIQCPRYTDTMLKASLLGMEPLGLKALARRHCGMRMQEYTDVMREARQELALDYLSRALDYAVEAERGNNGL